ncbi:large-conductance mechanosensitive channel protein MscL [Clostridium cellulovorans]|uniref:Large-conductance mechanosensitive channel n=1 Tax=Clostridium cellulovorans (strain ATCC 35296 / DSM 3052 / OCM 3 / 743B) TaxID=573061 RepID=D9SL43_CLOC7|nr:large-conductance mechanosensitive channel protein MscL [Clostridium cellulovorans]ADL51559.1 large conductance mechanosensitive channel protein [Clostridium cellulovorans 743B]
MLKEFKEFAMKGNVVDLAVGVIIGGAFGKIVSSLVNDVIMPLFGIILGGINFTSLTLNIRGTVVNYGTFIQNIVDFIIISFTIFVVIKVINKLNKDRQKKEEVKEAKKSEDIVLLEEIRNLLKENRRV